jgi:isochorismate pyruvate lyase
MTQESSWTAARRRAKGVSMSDPILSGPECKTMTEVRAGVDSLDRELVALLARRFAYMDAAARIKPARTAVRDEARKAQVIANACAEARTLGVPEPVVADLWERLVEASIAYELAAFDRR